MHNITRKTKKQILDISAIFLKQNPIPSYIKKKTLSKVIFNSEERKKNSAL